MKIKLDAHFANPDRGSANSRTPVRELAKKVSGNHRNTQLDKKGAFKRETNATPPNNACHRSRPCSSDEKRNRRGKSERCRPTENKPIADIVSATGLITGNHRRSYDIVGHRSARNARNALNDTCIPLPREGVWCAVLGQTPGNRHYCFVCRVSNTELFCSAPAVPSFKPLNSM